MDGGQEDVRAGGTPADPSAGKTRKIAVAGTQSRAVFYRHRSQTSIRDEVGVRLCEHEKLARHVAVGCGVDAGSQPSPSLTPRSVPFASSVCEPPPSTSRFCALERHPPGHVDKVQHPTPSNLGIALGCSRMPRLLYSL